MQYREIIRWALIPVVVFIVGIFSRAVGFFGFVGTFISPNTGIWLSVFLSSFLVIVIVFFMAPRYRILVALGAWMFTAYPTIVFLFSKQRESLLDKSDSALALLVGTIWAIGIVAFWISSYRKPLTIGLLLLAVAVIFLVLAVILGVPWYKKFVDYNPTPDTTPAGLRNIEIRSFYEYKLAGFIDSTWFWRIEADETTMRAVASRLRLNETREVPDDFFVWRPHWWPDGLPQNYLAFKTDGFLFHGRPSDGAYYFLLYDKDKEIGYVWFDSNF